MENKKILKGRLLYCFILLLILALIFLGLNYACTVFIVTGKMPVGSGNAGIQVQNKPFQNKWTDHNVVFLGLGDSITRGFGAKPGFSYFDLLVKNNTPTYPDMQSKDLKSIIPNLKILNLSVNYSTTIDHLKMQIPQIPDINDNTIVVVVMTSGGNDLIHSYGQNPPEDAAIYGADINQSDKWTDKSIERINRIIESLNSKYKNRCIIYLANIYDPTDGYSDPQKVGLPKWPDASEIVILMNNKIKNLCSKFENVHYVDIYSAFLGHGIHCLDFWRKTFHPTDATFWYDYNFEDPNPRGYDIIRRLYMNKIIQTLPGFQQIENVNVISVCNRTHLSSQKVADTFQIPKVFTDWKELINDNKIDAVMIGTWPYMHADITIAALEAGKHVLCEARMANNFDQAKKMYETAKKHPDLITQIVPSPFTLAFDKTIIEIIKSDQLGKILAVDLQAGNSFIDPHRTITWREQIEYSGNNTLTLGIWYEALMRWLGTAESVTAMGEVFVKTRPNENGRNVEIKIFDHLNVLARMCCGALANLRFSAVTGMAGGPKLTIFGEKATLCFYQDNLFIANKGDQKFSPVKIEPENLSRWRVEQEFVNAIRKLEKIKLTTFEDGIKYMQFTDAVIESAKTGKNIKITCL